MKKLIFAAALAVGSVAFAQVPYKIGIAGFTFCKKSLDETLQIMQKVDAHYLCVKDFHLSIKSTDAQIAAFKAKCAKYGVAPYAIGPIYVKDAAKLREQFEFAKRLGVKTVVGVPYEPTDAKDSWNKRKGSRKLLEEINRLVKEFDIRYAIHNHGPASPNMYPDVAYGWNLVKDLDPRVGFCMDVGWEYGCGKDPVETIRAHGDRIYDIHMKNFEIGKPNGRAIPLPRGKIDYVKVFTALAEVGYKGVCGLEYERDFTNNIVPIAESIGYARGVTDAIHMKAKMMPVPANANKLTEAEKAAGFELLFDGKNLPEDKWVGVKSEWEESGFTWWPPFYETRRVFPKRGWFVKDGCLTMRPVNGIANGKWFPLPPEDQKLGGGGDICTIKKYRDFEFSFDFRLTEAANSGVKYFYDETLNKGTCEEYQVLDEAHPDSTKGRDGNRRIASLYDLIPAHAEKYVKPLGEWNSGKVVSKGTKVEHWINGVKVLTYDRASQAFRDAVKASKYATWGKDAEGKDQPWGELTEGRLLIQDHSDSTVSYCNLKVRAL